MPELAPAARREAIALAHMLAHRRHLSIRGVQRVLLADHGIRRSLARIHADLHEHQCDRCEP